MGYESKLIVARPFHGSDEKVTGYEVIAIMDLGSMQNAFFPIKETFPNELETELHLDGSYKIEDCYGEHLRYGSVRSILKTLHACETQCHYRRSDMAINLLKSFTTSEWDDDIIIIHYGY